ncbi:uncharacterized protein si:ch73-100l22.3 isoform X2 [Xiphias gladius]|uniref:uncharacterized protein si:ch73-100l22.3 isoform X2 n=1 Tax=Xiphias gladius TaxID=8245 RepID=UPI001A9900A4|nr:uncharacterized protein si:ch73-100l22.3 isoform X2 [Xiphias gladius]
MEDYDTFVQRRLSQLRRSEEEEEEEGQSRPSPTSSLISVYGRPILPPLLSGEQREEMQRHRDAAQKAAGKRKLKDEPRMACVQNILRSVQLRKTPTLEELLQESEINTKSSYPHNTSGGSQSNFFIGTKDNVSLSPSPVRKGKDGRSLPPMKSAMYSAFFTSDVTPQQSYNEGCLVDQHDSQRGSQPSSLNGACHQSLTYENVKNTISVSGMIDAGGESRGFGSSEGAYGMGGFLLHSTSDTITKMPEIISHPPIDGEELERNGLDSSFCYNFRAVKGICCTSFQECSIICDLLPSEKSESSHLDSTQTGANPHSTTVLDLDKDHILERSEDPVSLSENSGFSDNPELSETSSVHCSPTTELQSQHEPTETEPADNHVDEARPSEEPYRLSLQALLKKSQEYRRRQRMLRNQAKNTKIQERTQEQPRARAEEQSLSDKENDEFPHKVTVTTEGKRTKEKRGTFIPTVVTSVKKSWENERMIESDFNGKKTKVKSESMHLRGDGNTKEMTRVEEATTFKNNKLNMSQEVVTEPKQISAFAQQQHLSTEVSPDQGAFNLTSEQSTTYTKGVFKGIGKYHTIPAPNFCMSPVHCKSKGSVRDLETVDAAETSKGKFDGNAGLNEEHNVEEKGNLGYQNNHAAVPCLAVNLMVEGNATNVLAKSSEHIDQLESNLSRLKVLISDLESTVKENLENHSQTESITQSEFSFKGVENSEQSKNDQHMQLHQNDCDYWGDRLRDSDVDTNDAEYREWPRGELFDNIKNMREDTGPEPIFSDAEYIPLIMQEKGKEPVDLREIRLVQTLATERVKEKGTVEQGLRKTYGPHGSCRKQQPPARCILSAVQQMRIPDAFRNVPSETMAPCNVSVLSDTSNHPVERRNEMAVEGHDSLNRSYNVDRPSGLWLLERSGSDLGSKSHLVQEKHLTPEEWCEGQGGVSKVKRRLLMHATEETEKSADTSRGTGCVVRPSSSTPRAAVRLNEGQDRQENKQEQLKQAHAAQVRALQDEHRRQQEELLQPSSPLSERYRPLLSAAMKGFLTRRLLRTERVAQLVRTIRDTQQFLHAFQQQSPSRGECCSRQDLLLQDRVTLQLRAARYEVYDIFFSLSAGERMQLIRWDRELARERELRRQSGHTGHPRGKSSLSAATQKSLERKRGMMIQKKVAERHREVVMRTGHKTGFSAEQPLETKRGQFRANPQRVLKSTYSTRPR